MKILALILVLGAVSLEPPWSELSLSIEPEAGISSDRLAICRVRVVNRGAHTWPGRTLHFEARALDGGVVVERARGRFGLSLAPYGTLETLIGFSAPYRQFEVAPSVASPDTGTRKRSAGKKSKRPSRRKPR